MIEMAGSRNRTGERQDRRGLMARNAKEDSMTAYRKDFGGMAMTDTEYANARGLFDKVDSDVSSAASTAREKIPEYSAPDMVRLVIDHGGGNEGKSYSVPRDAAGKILSQLKSDSEGHFDYAQINDDTYGIVFSPQALEQGREAFDDLQSKVDMAVESGKKRYEESAATAHRSIDMQVEGVEKQKTALVQKWQKNLDRATAVNSELMDRLTKSGILTQKRTSK